MGLGNAATVNGADTARVVIREDIFSSAPFTSCHAATICSVGHELMAAWFGGDHEGSSNVCIWASFKTNTGWTAPEKIADGIDASGKQWPCWNPVLFMDRSGLLYLHYKVGPNPREWKAYYKTSADHGRSWTIAQALPGSLLGPIKNKPLQLSDGRILYPSSRESLDEKTWTSHMEISDSTLTTWSIHPIEAPALGIIQPTLLSYPDGRIQALFRSRENTLVQSWSNDGGSHWTPAQSINLPNPNSGVDGVSISNGVQVLVYNPMKAGGNWWEGRSVLKVAVSTNGTEWKDVCTLEDHKEGEYSYPSVIAVNGVIHIVYTAQRKKIRYVQLLLNP